MHVPTEDEDARSTGDAVWENDLAWKREDLKEQGLLRMPERGIWQISEHGEREVEAWAGRSEAVFSIPKPICAICVSKSVGRSMFTLVWTRFWKTAQIRKNLHISVAGEIVVSACRSR